MPLSYHWNPNSLQIVCHGKVHLLPADDARYPWVLAALSQSEQAVGDVLDGAVPMLQELSLSWTVQHLLEGHDPQNENAWDGVDVFDDSVQAFSQACQYLLTNANVQQVRVVTDDGAIVYSLPRRIALALS